MIINNNNNNVAVRQRLTLEAVTQVPAPQHPGVEAELPVPGAEEALRGDLQRVQGQTSGALRVRVCPGGILQHHVGPGRVQRRPPPAAGAEHGGGGVQGLRREAQRRGPDGLVPGAGEAVAEARLLPHQGLDAEAFLTGVTAAAAAVLEHGEDEEEGGEQEEEGEGEEDARSSRVRGGSDPQRPPEKHASPPT